MKKHVSIILIAGLSFASIAGENLIVDGSFQKESTRWKGKDNIVPEESNKKNKICQIKLHKRDEKEFYQEFRGSDIKDFTLRYKIKKSADYKGFGYGIRFTFDKGGYEGRMKRVPSNHEWNTVEYRYSSGFTASAFENRNLSVHEHIRVAFIVKNGESGSLSFDDIEFIAEK
jgi:hypothetical protein